MQSLLEQRPAEAVRRLRGPRLALNGRLPPAAKAGAGRTLLGARHSAATGAHVARCQVCLVWCAVGSLAPVLARHRRSRGSFRGRF